MKVVWTLAAVLVVVFGIIAVVMFTGVYNVAASDPHNALVRWALATTRVNSVQTRAAEEVAVPPGLAEPEVIAAGAKTYARMCAECHGSPVEKGHDWAQHMMPKPPEMGYVAEFWEPQEIYWIVEHGFKMTGMPAWGPLMETDEIWQVVAFVEAYPQLSEAEYRDLTAGVSEEGGEQAQGEELPAPAEAEEEPAAAADQPAEDAEPAPAPAE